MHSTLGIAIVSIDTPHLIGRAVLKQILPEELGAKVLNEHTRDEGDEERHEAAKGSDVRAHE